MKKLIGLFRLIRFELPFAAGICVVMGQLLALGGFASIPEVLSGFFSVFFISASILVLNDYFDVETDRINAPHRPIASNIVDPNEALLLAIFLMIGGLALSITLGIIPLICVLILLIIGNLYNRKFKKSGLPGNLMVSFSVGMTFIYGGISVGLPFNKIAWFFGVIAAMIDLGEEIAADAMDMPGDALIESKSLAILFGKQVAIRTSSLIFLFVVLLTAVPFILNWFQPAYWIPILVMDFAIAWPAFKLITATEEQGRKFIRIIYLGATLGLVIFLIMRLFGI
jgi:geranylgeranylglycerol-phosphate geranylgeranyltransferase